MLFASSRSSQSHHHRIRHEHRHWHIVDSQSFPFNSSAVPELVRGAYSLTETYSPADVRDIVAYAKDRAVRIMVEIDTPGHSGEAS